MLHHRKELGRKTAVLIAAFFLLSLIGLATQNPKTFAGPSASIGIVDYQLLMTQHPDMAALKETMKAETARIQQDFDAKSATMNEQEKKAYFTQLQQQLDAKQQESLAAINDKVTAAVKDVAEAKGLSVVLAKNATRYGGEDITADVMKKISGQ
jgi:outer membrane protein